MVSSPHSSIELGALVPPGQLRGSRGMRRLRWAWTIRLTVMGFRRHQRATVVGVSAFAVAMLAIVICIASFPAPGSGGQAAAGVGVGAELVAFLREDLPGSSRDDLATVLGRLAGVAGVRLLGSDEALARMRADLGDRASVLDGVEEGFLPATLEVSLETGSQGRADAIAWRLRRMEGVTDVDVLRTGTDQRLIRAEAIGRHFSQLGFAMGIATALLALGIAAAATRRGRQEGALMAGLGFTAGEIAVPAAILGAFRAFLGMLLGALLLALLGLGFSRFASDWWLGSFVLGRLSGAVWAGTGVLAAAVATGAAFGWWGARPTGREVEELAPSD
jgi:cell division protein FtsX